MVGLAHSDYDRFLYEKENTPEYIQVPCGRCVRCRKKRYNEWRSRLVREHLFNGHKRACFLTLTISEKYYAGEDTDVKQYLRQFFDNYRKRFGFVPKHFFVSELGEKGGRLHLHGVIYDPHPDIPLWNDGVVRYNRRYNTEAVSVMKKAANLFRKMWKKGIVFCGYFASDSVTYTLKYIFKPNENNLDFYPRVYCSPGIGLCGLTDIDKQSIRRALLDFDVPSIVVSDRKVAAPRYYVSKSASTSEIYDLSLLRNCILRIRGFPFEVYDEGVCYTVESDWLAHIQAVRHPYIVSGREPLGNYCRFIRGHYYLPNSEGEYRVRAAIREGRYNPSFNYGRVD